jgi:3-deoxy-manno-octulosonate cytidylyltransferase (CMP-KDO synthetase)
MSAEHAERSPDGSRRALAIVPARLGSTRLARKMLLRESGRYLFQHTVEGVRRSRRVARVVLATDAPEIETAAREVGVECVRTRSTHVSGTDRVHEAFTLLEDEGPFDVVLNVQGDEPEVLGETLDPLVEAFADPAVELATLAVPMTDDDLGDPAVVKVVVGASGDALYFSRAPIPARAPSVERTVARGALRHVGVYAFRPAALARFCGLPRGRLEALESLEQLRWLEAGGRIRVLETSHGSIGIDTPEHYARFLERERSRPAAQNCP